MITLQSIPVFGGYHDGRFFSWDGSPRMSAPMLEPIKAQPEPPPTVEFVKRAEYSVRSVRKAGGFPRYVLVPADRIDPPTKDEMEQWHACGCVMPARAYLG